MKVLGFTSLGILVLMSLFVGYLNGHLDGRVEGIKEGRADEIFSRNKVILRHNGEIVK